MDLTPTSPPGTFDWLIGRQGFNWITNERFVREYSGVSPRGLAWMLPQGYALGQMGFGCEYALVVYVYVCDYGKCYF